MLAVMDEVGEARTKIRDMEEVSVSVSSSSAKRRKVDDSQLLVENLSENSVAIAAAGSISNADSMTSSSSFLWIAGHVELSNVEKDRTKSSDLERLEDSAVEIPTVNISQFSRETSPATSELSAEFMESSSSATTTKKKPSPSPRNSQSSAGMPSSAEIEDFFSAAEKREQKRFVEKYNYDIVKDVPLEGRYQWIRLKP